MGLAILAPSHSHTTAKNASFCKCINDIGVVMSDSLNYVFSNDSSKSCIGDIQSSNHELYGYQHATPLATSNISYLWGRVSEVKSSQSPGTVDSFMQFLCTGHSIQLCTQRDSYTERDRDRQRHRQANGRTDKRTDRKTHKGREGQMERQRDIETRRHRNIEM